MPAAPAPDNELERLNALKRYDILDTESEEIFDQITGVAADYFGAPVSLITLIDENRQWFKSHHGTEIRETPREIAFCGYSILDEDVLVVSDAARDPRFADNPMVTGDEHVRFYAGAPLVTQDGFRLGTLCVLDREARPAATPHQIEVLRRLARLVTYELDLRLAHRQRLEHLSIIAHELRSPLNAIMGFSDMMREEVFGPLGNPRYRAYAEDIHRGGRHLLSLVNDLLDLGKLQAGKFELREEEVDLREVISEVLDRARAGAEKQGVTVAEAIETDRPRAHVDRRAMVQILTNLISNAVKFSNQGGTVTARLRVEDAILIDVIDQGVGVPPEEIVKIFDSFVQGRHTRGGTGLGLSIVKHLAEIHGGGASAQSALGVGTTVTIRLPMERALG